MIVMIIINEKICFFIYFYCYYWFKMWCKSIIFNFIICSIFNIIREISFHIKIFKNLDSIEILIFENNKKWNYDLINTDVFNYCNSFLTLWFNSIDLFLIEWNDNEFIFFYFNEEFYINIRKNELFIEHQFHLYYKYFQILCHSHQWCVWILQITYSVTLLWSPCVEFQ